MVLNTVFAMITALLVIVFLKTNFSVISSRFRVLTFISLFGLFNGALSTLWMEKLNISDNLQIIKPVLLMVFSILLVIFILKVEVPKAILAFFVILMTVGLGNAAVPIFFMLLDIDTSPTLIAKNPSLFLVANILIYVIATLLTLLTQFIKLFRNIKNIKAIGFLLAVALLVIISLTGVHYISGLSFISFLSIFVSTLIYLASSIWYINKFQKYELQAEEQKQQAFYNESLSQMIQDLRRFKHDQANHLTVISAMIKMGKDSQAASYINELFNTSDIFLDRSVFDIKNAGLFGLISSKMDYAKKSGLTFNINTVGDIDAIPNVKISELCEIVGILLDNAIEAAILSENKQVEIYLEGTEGIINIDITNSCGTIPDINKLKADGYSTKGNNRGHGLGIVEKIIKKYNTITNTMSFNEEKMEFIQKIQIKKG